MTHVTRAQSSLGTLQRYIAVNSLPDLPLTVRHLRNGWWWSVKTCTGRHSKHSTPWPAIHEKQENYDAVIDCARRQVELEPWREPAHRQWMRALALNGHRSAALTQYEVCRKILSEELGVEPEAETVKLYERIRDGHLAPKPIAAGEPAISSTSIETSSTYAPGEFLNKDEPSPAVSPPP